LALCRSTAERVCAYQPEENPRVRASSFFSPFVKQNLHFDTSTAQTPFFGTGRKILLGINPEQTQALGQG